MSIADKDRERARELLTFTHRGQRVFRWSDERITFTDDDPYYTEGVNALAAALAEERERVLTEFRAQADVFAAQDYDEWNGAEIAAAIRRTVGEFE